MLVQFLNELPQINLAYIYIEFLGSSQFVVLVIIVILTIIFPQYPIGHSKKYCTVKQCTNKKMTRKVVSINWKHLNTIS